MSRLLSPRPSTSPATSTAGGGGAGAETPRQRVSIVHLARPTASSMEHESHVNVLPRSPSRSPSGSPWMSGGDQHSFGSHRASFSRGSFRGGPSFHMDDDDGEASATTKQDPQPRFEGARTQLRKGRALFNMDCLKMVPIFQMCSSVFVEVLSEYATNEIFQDGEVIFLEGSYGDKMYVLHHGQVEVIIGGRSVASLGAGSVFGEMAAMCKNAAAARRSATIRAHGLCDCRAVSRSALMHTTTNFPADGRIIELESKKRLSELRAKGLLPDQRRHLYGNSGPASGVMDITAWRRASALSTRESRREQHHLKAMTDDPALDDDLPVLRTKTEPSHFRLEAPDIPVRRNSHSPSHLSPPQGPQEAPARRRTSHLAHHRRRRWSKPAVAYDIDDEEEGEDDDDDDGSGSSGSSGVRSPGSSSAPSRQASKQQQRGSRAPSLQCLGSGRQQQRLGSKSREKERGPPVVPSLSVTSSPRSSPSSSDAGRHKVKVSTPDADPAPSSSWPLGHKAAPSSSSGSHLGTKVTGTGTGVGKGLGGRLVGVTPLNLLDLGLSRKPPAPALAAAAVLAPTLSEATTASDGQAWGPPPETLRSDVLCRSGQATPDLDRDAFGFGKSPDLSISLEKEGLERQHAASSSPASTSSLQQQQQQLQQPTASSSSSASSARSNNKHNNKHNSNNNNKNSNTSNNSNSNNLPSWARRGNSFLAPITASSSPKGSTKVNLSPSPTGSLASATTSPGEDPPSRDRITHSSSFQVAHSARGERDRPRGGSRSASKQDSATLQITLRHANSLAVSAVARVACGTNRLRLHDQDATIPRRPDTDRLSKPTASFRQRLFAARGGQAHEIVDHVPLRAQVERHRQHLQRNQHL